MHRVQLYIPTEYRTGKAHTNLDSINAQIFYTIMNVYVNKKKIIFIEKKILIKTCQFEKTPDFFLLSKSI